MKSNIIYNKDCLIGLKLLPSSSIDLLLTDPPYGINFMGTNWLESNDIVNPQGTYEKKKGFKKLPRQSSARIIEFFTPIWKESLRVLKPGAFAFVMCIPRQDCLSRMIVSLEDAGFNVSFTSIYWAYASGFPKAMSISKAADKRGGRPPQEYRAFASYIKEKRIRFGLSMKDIAKHFLSKTGGITGCVWNWENGANVPTKKQMIILRKVLKLDNRFDELIERAEAEREIIFSKGSGRKRENLSFSNGLPIKEELTLPATPQAQALDGSYGGFQPKPAIEVVIVAMKPLSEKTYIDQALANRHGISWLDDCRVPYKSSYDKKHQGDIQKGQINAERGKFFGGEGQSLSSGNLQGRFPGNLLVSNDCLNDGKILKTGDRKATGNLLYGGNSMLPSKTRDMSREYIGDSGSFSRYFSLDSWFDKKLKELPEGVRRTFPFLIVPKASKAEKNRGCEGLEIKLSDHGQINYYSERYCEDCQKIMGGEKYLDCKNRGHKIIFRKVGNRKIVSKNNHPCVKPIKFFSYLITLGSRPDDLILDPFLGSGTTPIAAKMLDRKYIGYEINKEYFEIAKARLAAVETQLSLFT